MPGADDFDRRDLDRQLDRLAAEIRIHRAVLALLAGAGLLWLLCQVAPLLLQLAGWLLLIGLLAGIGYAAWRNGGWLLDWWRAWLARRGENPPPIDRKPAPPAP